VLPRLARVVATVAELFCALRTYYIAMLNDQVRSLQAFLFDDGLFRRLCAASPAEQMLGSLPIDVLTASKRIDLRVIKSQRCSVASTMASSPLGQSH
jgi:hypothetical protein